MGPGNMAPNLSLSPQPSPCPGEWNSARASVCWCSSVFSAGELARVVEWVSISAHARPATFSLVLPQPLSVWLGMAALEWHSRSRLHGERRHAGGVLWVGSVSGNLTEKKAEGVMLLLTSTKERRDKLTLTPVFVLWSLFLKWIKNANKMSVYLLLWPLLILHLIIMFYPHKYLL